MQPLITQYAAAQAELANAHKLRCATAEAVYAQAKATATADRASTIAASSMTYAIDHAALSAQYAIDKRVPKLLKRYIEARKHYPQIGGVIDTCDDLEAAERMCQVDPRFAVNEHGHVSIAE